MRGLTITVITLMLCLVLSTLAQAVPKQVKARSEFMFAQELVGQEKYDEAIKHALNARTLLGETNGKIEHLLCLSYYKTRDYYKARQAMEAFFNVVPESESSTDAYNKMLLLYSKIEKKIKQQEEKLKANKEWKKYKETPVIVNGKSWQSTDNRGELFTLREAERFCEQLEEGNITNWRLPTKEEMRSLIYCSNGHPTPTVDTGAYWNGPPSWDLSYFSLAGNSPFGIPNASCSDDNFPSDYLRPTISKKFHTVKEGTWLKDKRYLSEWSYWTSTTVEQPSTSGSYGAIYAYVGWFRYGSIQLKKIKHHNPEVGEYVESDTRIGKGIDKAKRIPRQRVRCVSDNK